MARKQQSKDEPVSGTKEWACHNVICYGGCRHDCSDSYPPCTTVTAAGLSPAGTTYLCTAHLVQHT